MSHTKETLGCPVRGFGRDTYGDVKAAAREYAYEPSKENLEALISVIKFLKA